MEDLKKLIDEAKKDFDSCESLTELDNSKSKYIGKTGPLTEAMKENQKLVPLLMKLKKALSCY